MIFIQTHMAMGLLVENSAFEQINCQLSDFPLSAQFFLDHAFGSALIQHQLQSMYKGFALDKDFGQ